MEFRCDQGYAILVRCMDPRLEESIQEFLILNGLVGYTYVISLAGGPKDLAVEPDGFTANQIRVACRFHEIRTVFLMSHLDCRAYGGNALYVDAPEAERALHLGHLEDARQHVLALYPGMTVVKLLAVPREDGTWEIEEIV
ncbi:MAG: carbonic anhydrase [Patescibacteria group bacterium]|jgi:carbonic anhydrase